MSPVAKAPVPPRSGRMQTRPTSFGLAFVAATERSIMRSGKGFRGALKDPSVHWVARRVALSDNKSGMVTEPTITANLIDNRERDALRAEYKRLGVIRV